MSQLLKKYALLAACAVLALCFATRPAHAQSVAMGGSGEHLLFAYWAADMYTNTNVNIHSPLGVRVSGETMNVVRVMIRNDMGESVRDFKICLMPGDSWTATLSMGGLMVMNAGECDEDVYQTPPDRNNRPHPTPMMEEMASLGGATSGYLEAWLAPTSSLNDDTVACGFNNAAGDGDVRGAASCPNLATPNAPGVGVGSVDTDTSQDHATPKYISGSAMLVSPMSGFSSSYNAVALMGCGDPALALADATTVNEAMIGMTDAERVADDGDGCWTVDRNIVAGETVGMEDDGAPIQMALMNRNIDILTGRWTAIDNDEIMSHTKLVLTLPVNNLNYEGKEADPATDTSTRDVSGTDPVSIFAFDDSGKIILENRELMLGMNVNMCKFSMDMDHDHGDEDMGMDEDMMMMPMLSCNGMDVGELDGMAGEFRIFNGAAALVGDDPHTTATEADDRLTRDGTEPDDDDLGIQVALNVATDDDDMPAGGQVPGGAIAAIGLNFSYFMGTDGMQYDQATPLQWIDIDVPDADTDASDGIDEVDDL